MEHGAGIGFVAQLSNLSAPWLVACGALAAAAFAAGAIRANVPALGIASILATWLFGPALALQHPQAGIAVAYLAGLSLAALAIRQGSVLVLLVTAGGAGVTLACAVRSDASFHPLLLTAALLMAYPLVAWGPAERVAPATHRGGRIAFGALALFASFPNVANALRLATPAPAVFFVAVAPLTVVLAWCLLRGLRRAEVDPLVRGESLLATATVPALLAGLSLETATGAIVVANLAVAFLALGRITRGRSRGDRASLVEGLVLAALLVLARLVDLGRAV